MIITKSCHDTLPGKQVHIGSIALGTVFRFGDHVYGPYLRVTNGYVSLGINIYYPDPSAIGGFENYRALPHAKLVTGEE
jgi:hypothetical protein